MTRLSRLLWLTSLALTGCGVTERSPAPPVIINNTSDGGATVLITVLVCGLLLTTVAAVVGWMKWSTERAAHRDLTHALELTTGLSLPRLRAELTHLPHVSGVRELS